MHDRPFRILALQQIAVGGLDKQRLRELWVDTLGIEATGSYQTFVRRNLGEIEIPQAGDVTLTVRPDPQQWHAINLRQVSLTPVK